VPRIHVFIGTKAQYIKTAPLLRLMDERGVVYRLIDSGQHAELATGLRRELGVRDPDHLLGGERDVTNIRQAVGWSATIALRLANARDVRAQIFGGHGGVCVVHGDTPSTLLSALLARRAGLRVAHLEAGLRSHSLLHPFPEEIIRLVVMRVSDVLFAPDDTAVDNLRQMKVRGRVVPVAGNTVIEALRHSLAGTPVAPTGPVVVTMHRVENLHRAARVSGFARLAARIARDRAVTFVVHGPTSEVMTRLGLLDRLTAAGVKIVELVPHAEFTRMLAAAPFVITDGGSIQEECALLGVPALLWRDRTERPDGVGANVVLSHHHPATVDAFIADPERFRRPAVSPPVSPSAQILDELLVEAERGRRR